MILRVARRYMPVGIDTYTGNIIDKSIKKEKRAFFKYNRYFVFVLSDAGNMYQYKVKAKEFIKVSVGQEITVSCRKTK